MGEGVRGKLQFCSLTWPLSKHKAQLSHSKSSYWLYSGSSGGSDGNESAYSTGDPASFPGSGKPPEEGNGTPLQYSCWRIPRTEELAGSQGPKELNMTEQLTLLKG